MNSWKLPLIVALAMLAAGCARGLSEQKPATVIGKPCPSLKAYTCDELNKAADELDAIPAPCVTCDLMDDYSLLRDQCRIGPPQQCK